MVRQLTADCRRAAARSTIWRAAVRGRVNRRIDRKQVNMSQTSVLVLQLSDVQASERCKVKPSDAAVGDDHQLVSAKRVL